MPINAYWLKDRTAPYATVLRIVHAHCHPETDYRAYDDLKARTRAADPDDDEIAVFKSELRRLMSGELDRIPPEALDTAAEYDERDDEEFLRRLWRDLYPDEPAPHEDG